MHERLFISPCFGCFPVLLTPYAKLSKNPLLVSLLFLLISGTFMIEIPDRNPKITFTFQNCLQHVAKYQLGFKSLKFGTRCPLN